MPKKISLTTLIIFLILFALAFSFSVKAIAVGGMGVRPAFPDPENKLTRAWFIYTLEPGETKEDTALISNSTDEEKTFKIYPVDSMLSNDGSFTLAPEDAEKKEVGAWLKFKKQVDKTIEEVTYLEITLGPEEEKEIQFILRVPENADVGEHSGGLIIQEKEKPEAEAGTMAVVLRIGARIYVTVPGEIIKKLSLTQFEVKPKNGKYLINFSLKNEGNVSLTPKVKLTVTNLFFHKGDKVLERTPQVSRGAELQGYFEWQRPQYKFLNYPGRFLFQAEISYTKEDGEIKVIESDPVTIWVIPLLEALVLLSIILVLIILLVVKKISVRKERKFTKKYEVRAGETIETIASKFGMNWKKLAKINKLKPPYILKTKQEILILKKK